ncbi:ABC transporter permease [Pseudoteredinibacter isoporae]|uniref:Putative ABC transport system permease protein n=1 Tax=Pseudoteredinibacter isoporae TaxID=570281 RepID=A0A7X0JQU0_9GAMM|nr:ABC transporter permease [Pseudoteredinibacter isoporae]MBB6520602.1 putative ABC transport system permease protein [Pseudoteredinibacter isoporae]NHO86169.1 FtsX-like permease family protein [Pseudoteredinibacter isoporae]NIB25380.1 FtsX-like permease family protein [Pseudoteredinibacter isoporae]
MALRDDFIDAVDQLWHHKLRTLLTLLGIIFGVGAVIAMISVGEGAEEEALRLIDSMGVRNLIVEEREIDDERLKELRKHSIGLSLGDVEAALDTMPFVVNYSAEKDLDVHTLFSPHAQGESKVQGVSESHFKLSRNGMLLGRWFTEDDSRRFAQVAVLSEEAAAQLFPQREAMGEVFKVNHVWLEVVGVLKNKQLSKDSFQGVELSVDGNVIYLPLSTIQKRFKHPVLSSELDRMKLELAPGISPTAAAKGLEHLLLKRHGQEKDFDVLVPAALLQQHKATQRIFNIIMSCVAGISLLVGGIGIMNIMLASILERTKEIGLLRAVGATQRDIRNQFIVESFAISALGGLLGIFLGFALAAIISVFSGWPVAWSPVAVLVSVVFCCGVGLLFGIYPAIKASRLDPITALQRE